jgi:hypothetical protein
VTKRTAVPATPKISEHEFQQALILALGARPDLRVWRQNTGEVEVRDARGRTTGIFRAGPPTGAADISGLVRPEGWRLEIECKASDGKRSVEQERWAKFIHASGGVYTLVRVKDLLDLEENVRIAVADVEAAVAGRRAGAGTAKAVA